MTDSRKIVKVFLASPGDLSEERKIAKNVVDEFNELYAEIFGYHVDLIGWEDTVSRYGRPQATINKELARCEFFAGIMWERWGTPPDTVGKYTSGFEEEFFTTLERREKEGRPEISLFFKEITPNLLRDPGNDLKKVIEFKDTIINEKKLLFEEFTNTSVFEKKFRRCISNYVTDLKELENEHNIDKTQAPITINVGKECTERKNGFNLESPLSIEGVQFLRELLSKTETSLEGESILAVEVARFRLLANIIGNQKNDLKSLGVHDANLLFIEQSNFTFGHNELGGLLSSGFEHYSGQNAPLWRWFSEIGGYSSEIMPYWSIIKLSIDTKVGVLTAMRLILEPLPENRDFFLTSWFSKNSDSAIKIAALNYLRDCGITNDLPIVIQEFDCKDYQTSRSAADAIININLRDSREKAIRALYELQPTSISQKVLKALFNNKVTLESELLLKGVDHRNSDVRCIVVELLCERSELPHKIAEQLLNDNNAEIRYEALKSLISNGRIYSDSEVENVLIKKTNNNEVGLLAHGLSRSNGEDVWADFKLQRLYSLTDKELESSITNNSVFEQGVHFILAKRQFKYRSEALRCAVDNQYKNEFSSMLQSMNVSGEILEKIQSFEKHLCKEFTRKGLDIICSKFDQSDLNRVRFALKSGFVEFSTEYVKYLAKFGEWDDISLIIDSVKQPGNGYHNSVLTTSDEHKYKTAAHAIYTLGKSRMHDILAMSMPSKLLSQLIIEITDKAFLNLSDTLINQVLGSEEEGVRKVASLKCVKVLPKRRIERLLNEYAVSGESYYYNVVHWLDFGVSTPRDRSKLAVKKVLNNDLD